MQATISITTGKGAIEISALVGDTIYSTDWSVDEVTLNRRYDYNYGDPDGDEIIIKGCRQIDGHWQRTQLRIERTKNLRFDFLFADDDLERSRPIAKITSFDVEIGGDFALGEPLQLPPTQLQIEGKGE